MQLCLVTAALSDVYFILCDATFCSSTIGVCQGGDGGGMHGKFSP